MATTSKLGRIADKLAVEAEPGLTTAQLMVSILLLESYSEDSRFLCRQNKLPGRHFTQYPLTFDVFFAAAHQPRSEAGREGAPTVGLLELRGLLGCRLFQH